MTTPDADDLTDNAGAAIASAARIVVKVGSALLIDQDGQINDRFLTDLVCDLISLKQNGTDAIIVTSGAIALGRGRLGLSGRLRLDESQAASAAGQSLLINAWQGALMSHDVAAAQVLLTLSDTDDRRRYLNARATLERLLALGAAPIVNENDTIATSEIRYGDNDRLAAHTAQLIGADVLVLLSDVDGLYTANPQIDPDARHVPVVRAITPMIDAMATGANKMTGVGSGGMATKIAAAKIAGGAGAATIIASGAQPRPLRAVLSGGRATLFTAQTTPARARKTWIKNTIGGGGGLIIDAGAAAALTRGASLLPAGVVRVRGAFSRGDVIDVVRTNGDVLARGVVAYDDRDARIAAGLKSEAIDAQLGYRRRSAIIDRDDMVMMAPAAPAIAPNTENGDT